MAHIDISLNFIVHLEITDKEKKQYLSKDEVLSIETQDIWISAAETALIKQLRDTNENVPIDPEYSIGEIFE